ncbi:MAG: hypothetical protein M3Y87_20095 [Myxococcota bacterium]|nr:hypothetical protein [Myxococcota bacterium]
MLLALVAVAAAPVLAARAQAPAGPTEARVGEVAVEAVQQWCHTRRQPCQSATRRVEVRMRTGATPAQVRVVGMERWEQPSARRGVGRWVSVRIRRLQLETQPPIDAQQTISIAAQTTRTLGILHAEDLPLPMAGVRYRVELVVNGAAVTVQPSERVVIEHPRRR